MTGISSARLLELSGIVHGFFDRSGGVSKGLYESLNCGLGSQDNPADVTENRRRVAAAVGAKADELVTLYQIHSAEVVEVTKPWEPGKGPHADGMVTTVRGLTLGVLAADCTPILFGDAEAKVIGACHAGWKGAFAGVAEATLDAMEALGADRARIVAAIGPTIRQASYEVGSEFRDRFVGESAANATWFVPGERAQKFQFDLPGYLTDRLRRAGVGEIGDCGVCTYENDTYFSYRRATHRGEPDYGRNISVITLKQ